MGQRSISRRCDGVLLAAACALVLLAGGAAGCNEDVGDDPTLDGGTTINGYPYVPQSQGAVQVYSSGDVKLPSGWYVEMTDQYNGCWAIMTAPPDETLLQFKFPQAGVGVYDVTPSNTQFIVNKNDKAATPVAGKLQLLTADEKHLVGTYDVTFMSGERLAGTFDAELCR